MYLGSQRSSWCPPRLVKLADRRQWRLNQERKTYIPARQSQTQCLPSQAVGKRHQVGGSWN